MLKRRLTPHLIQFCRSHVPLCIATVALPPVRSRQVQVTHLPYRMSQCTVPVSLSRSLSLSRTRPLFKLVRVFLFI